MKINYLDLLLHPFILGAALSALIFFTYPRQFSPYTLELVEQVKNPENGKVYYCDLDGDGQSEKITFKNQLGELQAVLVHKGDRIVNQWNFRGTWLHVSPPFWSDLNNDGQTEISLFLWRNDSVYVNIFNPLNGTFLIREKPIAAYHPLYNALDLSMHTAGFFDTNNDGWKEFYFSSVSGYGGEARFMYGLDIARDTLYISPSACINILKPYAFDLDNDGLPEFLGETQAVANCDSLMPFSDYFSWLTVYDNRMNFKFNPRKIGHYPSILSVRPVKADGAYRLMVMNVYSGIKNIKSSLALYTIRGEKLRERFFEYNEVRGEFSLFRQAQQENDFVYLIRSSGKVELIDAALNRDPVIALPQLSVTRPVALDADSDGREELLFLTEDREKIILCRDDFSHEVSLNLRGLEFIEYATMIRERNGEPLMFIRGAASSYRIRYRATPLYYLQYLLYGLIYLLIVGIVYAIQRLQRYREQQKAGDAKKITELQIKALKNQLDPHFTFNILNSIGALFLKNDRDQVDYLFGKYARLLRQAIVSSDSIRVSLEDELDFVTNYLELEKYRLPHALTYEIVLDERVDMGLSIPKMLIHTFVENAVKHGLMPLEREGRIRIAVLQKGSSTVIEVADDGVGRERARERAVFSTGRGLNVLNQMLVLYQRITQVGIEYIVTDLYDDNNRPRGTEVMITIPGKR